MQHCDDAYAAMLLTLSLSADREEFAHPLSTAEFRALDADLRENTGRGPGQLLGKDISGIMQLLQTPEPEALRLFTLLNRSVQLTYILESFADDNIEVITQYDSRYPRRLLQRLGESAPPVFYAAGHPELLNQPMLGVCGISGVKTSPVVRASVERIVSEARRLSYAVATGGELGVAHLATEKVVLAEEGNIVRFLGGGLREFAKTPEFIRLYLQGRGLAISLEHPDALFTVSHAAARNRLLFALSEAAFVFNTDGKRGELEALRGRLCDYIYAWNGYPGNQPLISRGALPFGSAETLDFNDLKRHWLSSRSEQLSLFDILDEQPED